MDIIRDKFTSKKDPGAFTPKQAIYAAALGTVGLGSVGGMAVAIYMGGPGAVLWVVVVGLFAGILKFSEIYLGHKYREIENVDSAKNGNSDIHYVGGPFKYFEASFKLLKMPKFGRAIGKLYAFIMIFATFVTTNMFQCGQTSLILSQNFPILEKFTWAMGLVAVAIIGAAILGGISAIGRIAGALVPFMTISYIISALIVLIFNFTNIPMALLEIVRSAFNVKAATGGLFGAIAYGGLRAMFTTESGSGTSSVPHSSAKTKDPVMEGCTGFVEVLFPIVVCVMTGLVIVVTGAHKIGGVGVVMTGNAFKSVADWFSLVLVVQIPFLAMTTAIAWGAIYGPTAWNYFFNVKPDNKLPGQIFKVIFLMFSFAGFVVTDQSFIVRTGDYFWITMCMPNILVLFLMRNYIKDDLSDYIKRLKNGEIKEVKEA